MNWATPWAANQAAPKAGMAISTSSRMCCVTIPGLELPIDSRIPVSRRRSRDHRISTRDSTMTPKMTVATTMPSTSR